MMDGVEETWLLLRPHARPAYGLVRLTQEETYVEGHSLACLLPGNLASDRSLSIHDDHYKN